MNTNSLWRLNYTDALKMQNGLQKESEGNITPPKLSMIDKLQGAPDMTDKELKQYKFFYIYDRYKPSEKEVSVPGEQAIEKAKIINDISSFISVVNGASGEVITYLSVKIIEYATLRSTESLLDTFVPKPSEELKDKVNKDIEIVNILEERGIFELEPEIAQALGDEPYAHLLKALWIHQLARAPIEEQNQFINPENKNSLASEVNEYLDEHIVERTSEGPGV